jgi:hypothetical protein
MPSFSTVQRESWARTPQICVEGWRGDNFFGANDKRFAAPFGKSANHGSNGLCARNRFD